MAVAVDPVEEFRAQFEQIVARPDLTPTEKQAKIGAIQMQLTVAQGLLATYLRDEKQMEEGQRILDYEMEQRLRSNASIAESLADRGMFTWEQLHEQGYFSHAELDALETDDRLSEAIDWAEKLHPRDRSGKWRDKFGGALKTNLSSPHPPAEPLVPAARTPKPKAPVKAPKTPTPKVEPAPDKFAERKAALEKRTIERTKEGLKRAQLTDAEQHFNDAGKVSQRELGKYVDTAATRPHTVDLYSEMRDGKRVWDESRRELHEKIIDRFLRQRVFDPAGDGGKGAWVLSDTAPPLTPSESPQVLFSGGGYAAGKSSVLKINRAQGGEPPSGYDGPVLVLDPDAIKAELPEFQELLGTDPEANMAVYQEAWSIAQEIQARAQEQKLNMVVDGISNTSPDEMIERARSFLDRGYTAKAIYVDIPTEEALSRAAHRARTATSDADRRHIPEIIMRSVHRDVASTVPNMLRRLQQDGIPLDVEVWDNNQGKDEQGGFRPPKKFLTFEGGVETVDDPELWAKFQNKAYEKILAVEEPHDTPQQSGDSPGPVKPTVEKVPPTKPGPVGDQPSAEGNARPGETPGETVKPQDWTAPPPPVGKKGETTGGRGYSSDAAFGTNTKLGHVGEAAFLQILGGGEILHPEGKGAQSPLDVHYDGYGFEVKAVSTKTLGYKATPKPHEIDSKQAHADELGVKSALAIVVIDSDTGKAHAYYRDGLKGGRLSEGTGWKYLGSTEIEKPQIQQAEGELAK